MTDEPVRDPNALAVAPPGAERRIEGALPGDPRELAMDAGALSYQSGLEIEARSQWAYARRRFVRHRLALSSVVILLLVFGCGVFANVIAPYGYKEINLRALKMLRPGGILVTCSCSFHVGEEDFMEMLQAAAFDAGWLLRCCGSGKS